MNPSLATRPSDQTVDGRVSIIVPTRNSTRTLERCLTSARAQVDGDSELIVADNSSNDGSDEVARRLANRFLTVGPERSAQRNAGASIASGEFLVFVDSDMVVPPDLASAVRRAFDAETTVTGLVIPERSVGEGFWATCKVLEKRLYLGQTAVEAARAFRRSAFFRVGGFDESLTGVEDWDLADRVAADGRIGRVDVYLTHDEGRLTLRYDLRKKFYYGQSFVDYFRKNLRTASRRLARVGASRRLRLLAEDPVHGIGLVLLKLLELTALVAGMAVAVISSRRLERAPTAPPA